MQKYRRRDSASWKRRNLRVDALKREIDRQCAVQIVKVSKRKANIWVSQKITSQNGMCWWVKWMWRLSILKKWKPRQLWQLGRISQIHYKGQKTDFAIEAKHFQPKYQFWRYENQNLKCYLRKRGSRIKFGWVHIIGHQSRQSKKRTENSREVSCWSA